MSDDEASISLPPEDLEQDAEANVLQWDAALDDTDYLTLLQLSRPNGDEPLGDELVRRAFHAFALAFHPDRWREADDDVRAAANRVFCRGSEAYRVLLDPLLSRRYVRQLADGHVRMSNEEIAQTSRISAAESVADETLAEVVKSAAAMPFAKRADELLAAGDVKQARLQVQLAAMKEPGNARLQERLRMLDAQIAARRPSHRP